MVIKSDTVSAAQVPEWAGVWDVGGDMGGGGTGDGRIQPILGGTAAVVVDPAVDGAHRALQVRARSRQFRARVVGNLGDLTHIAIRNKHGKKRNGG